MALRLIQIFLPENDSACVEDLFRDRPILGSWQESSAGGQVVMHVLLDAEETEALLDGLSESLSRFESTRVVLLAVEALLPRPPVPEPAPVPDPPTNGKTERTGSRISREELYHDVVETVRLGPTYLAMVALSTIVAAIGLLRGNVAVIIGAMVIAPMLGPNMALSLATTLGDGRLARQAVKVTAAGMTVALALAVLIGFLFAPTPEGPEIASRTRVSLEDVALAIASGAAGAIAFTTGVPAALVGVMVAVALLPPLATSGMLAGAGHWPDAARAVLLLATNLICVNLAAVTTFVMQGLRPADWGEADRARTATRLALGLWAGLLAGLVLLIVLSRKL
ncbi:MAG TPA: TIGR00341 family protein [Planctomycetaceae bacterium]|nr:TIGR00341 family protein [Planctomycetaceae bacterium]